MNFTLKSGQDGKLHIICIFPHTKKCLRSFEHLCYLRAVYFLIWIGVFLVLDMKRYLGWYLDIVSIMSWDFGSYLNILIWPAVTLLRFRTHIPAHFYGLWFKCQSHFQGLLCALVTCLICVGLRSQYETCVMLVQFSDLLLCWFWSVSLEGHLGLHS